MYHPYNKHILRALETAKTLMDIANKGEAASNDDGCRILFGVMRDCACKIRKHAERECQVHEAKINVQKVILIQ